MRKEFHKINKNDAKFTRKCAFCLNKTEDIDYKDVSTLGKYLNRWSKIESRERNGNCARHQRWLVTAIKRARYLALLPYVSR